jgi:hypothetical protein
MITLCAITKFLLLETFFAFWVLLVWYKLSIKKFVMLKTWQFSQKKISKNYSNLHKEKNSPKNFSIYLLIKQQNLSRKKSLVQ